MQFIPVYSFIRRFKYGVFLPLNSAWNPKPSLWCYNKLYEHVGCCVTYQDAESYANTAICMNEA